MRALSSCDMPQVLSLFGQFPMQEIFRKIDLNEAQIATHWSIAVSSGLPRKKVNENVEDRSELRPLIKLSSCHGEGADVWTQHLRPIGAGCTSHQRRPSGEHARYSTSGFASQAVTNACVLCGTTCKNKVMAASDQYQACRSDIRRSAFST